MAQSSTLPRFCGSWFAGTLALLSADRAVAQEAPPDVVSACLAAHVSSQKLQRSSALKAARDALFACSRPECPELVRADCTRWLADTEQAIPSVIVSARVGTQEVFDVSLAIDGQPVAERLEGSAIELDPGIHTFKLQLAPWPDIEQRLLIVRGEKQRVLQFSFGPSKPKVVDPALGPATPDVARIDGKPVPSHRPIPIASYVLAGGAVLGLASFATFATLGKIQQEDIEDNQCRPFCPDVDAVRTKYYIADVSLALGVVAAAAAVIVYVNRPTEPLPAQGRSAPRKPARTSLPELGIDAKTAAGVVRWGGEF